MKYGGTGRFCGTAGLTPTRPLPNAGSPNETRGRMGAARGDMARLAARDKRLAGQIRTDTVGVRRDRAAPFARRARTYSRERREYAAKGRPRSEEIGRELKCGGISHDSYGPQLDARFLSNICPRCSGQAGPSELEIQWL